MFRISGSFASKIKKFVIFIDSEKREFNVSESINNMVTTAPGDTLTTAPGVTLPTAPAMGITTLSGAVTR